MGAVALSTDVRVKRVPVSVAEFGERFGGQILITLTGDDHQIPIGRCKGGVARRGFRS
jgi:hypothetical protein